MKADRDTHPTHVWTRPNYFASDKCGNCGTDKRYAAAANPCPKADRMKGNLFTSIERTVIDFFDAIPAATTLQEASEWYAELGGRRVSISALAIKIFLSLGGEHP